MVEFLLGIKSRTNSRFAQILRGFENYGRVSAAEEAYHGGDPEDHQ
jgi:hypothetical protein